MNFITALLSHRRKAGLLVAAVLLALAFGGSALLTTVAATTTALENLSPLEVKRKNDHKMLRAEVVKLRLIGSYAVTGTDADGNLTPSSTRWASRSRHQAPLSWNGTTARISGSVR